jgi:two-component system, chemotaxis family, CheB/CheR fusion protein
MTATTDARPGDTTPLMEKAAALALRLAHTENALRALTSGQVDAIIDPEGRAHLLRPAQESLRRSEQRLQTILECAADVIVVVDREGLILSQSRAAKRVLGYEPDELIGKRFFELIHPEDLPILYIAYFNVIEGFAEHATVRFRHRDPQGLDRLVEAAVGQLRGFSPANVVLSLRPATLAIAVREKAVPATTPPSSSRGKDLFLAMLSHELRAPLNPALLGVEELLDDAQFTAANPVLTMIRRNIQLQVRLLEELTDFTTVGEHKVRLRLEALDAHEYIRFVLEICRNEIAAARVDVRCFFWATESKVAGDAARFQQVMWNLVKNAVKFSPLGSILSVTTINDPPGHLTIQFSDQGIGIEPELLPRVFDAFHQGNHSAGGLGLGLFIAQGLAGAQGGSLTAHSEGRGKGASLHLTMPLFGLGEERAHVEKEAGFFPLATPGAADAPVPGNRRRP